ncbi:MAG: cobalamin-binding protein [Haloquadratum sp.]
MGSTDPGTDSVASDAGTTGDGVDRVVSLAPSATTTLSAMGAEDCLVGVTTHCDVDREPLGGWLNPDYDRLAELHPDLVCTADRLQRDVRDELVARGYDVCHVEPDDLAGVVGSFATLGRAIGRAEAASRLVEETRERLAAVHERAGADPTDVCPVVYCEEWGDPPMAAGNWVPEAVELAGGRYPFCDAGERSREVSHAEIADADPDHVVVHHCGHGDRADPDILTARGWDLDAAVHVVDDDLLNQPSPRLIDGIERLAELFRGRET